jgi:hypothetical protein
LLFPLLGAGLYELPLLLLPPLLLGAGRELLLLPLLLLLELLPPRWAEAGKAKIRHISPLRAIADKY